MRRILLTLFLIFSNVVNATNVSFAWESQPDYPPGVTYEFQANECAQSGITGTTTTCNLVGSPGDPLHAQVRAISPDSGQWFDSAWTALDTVIPGVALLYTNPEAQTNLSVSRTGGVTVADPLFAELGTPYSGGGSSYSSGTASVAGVVSGDLVIFLIQRDSNSQITAVTANGAGITNLTYLGATRTVTETGFDTRLYAAIATSSAATLTMTVTWSGSAKWVSLLAARWSNGSSIVSLTPLATAQNATGGFNYAPTSTSRETSSTVTVSSGKRALLIAVGTDWNDIRTHTAANGWTKRADGTTSSSIQFIHDRIVDAGTYGGAGTSNRFATTSVTDNYLSLIIALEIAASDSASLSPDFMQSITLQAVNTSNW